MFFKSKTAIAKAHINKAATRESFVIYRVDGEDVYAWRDSHGAYWAANERLKIQTLHDGVLSKNCQGEYTAIEPGDYRIDDFRAAVAHLNVRGYGVNDVVLAYTYKGEKWYVNKTSFDVPNFIRLFSETALCWFEVPRRLFSNLSGYGNDNGVRRVHPYTMTVINWADSRRESTRFPKMLEMFDTDKPGETAYNVLVPVPSAPGLQDHLARKIVFDLTVLDDSSTPVFNIAELAKAIRRMEHERPDYTVDLNNVFIKFGKNPNPIQVKNLHSEAPGHRFYCSVITGMISSEKIVRADTVPESYP